VTTEIDLRDRLHRIAEQTAPPEDPYLATRIAALSRSRRRQRIGLTAVVAGVAAVVVAVPAVLADPANVPAGGPAAPATAGTTAAVDVFAGPTRGQLAGDAAFIEGVRQLPWTRPHWPTAVDDPSVPGIPDPSVETRRVVWAGDVAGARWALVAGENTARPQGEAADPERQTDLGALSGTAVAWFVGPPGATPEQMVVQDVPRGVDPTRPLAYSDADTGAVVVVTAPGDVVEVSERPRIAADATVTRNYIPVDAPDGVAVLALPPTGSGYGLALSYRVLRNGVEVVTTRPDGRADLEDVGPPTPTATWLRDRPEPSAADSMTTSTMHTVLAASGLRAEEVAFTVLWSGDVPAPAPRPARAAVVTALLPSGAVWIGTSLGLAFDDGSVGGTTCGSALRPADQATRTVVAVCQATDMSADSPGLRSLVVVGTAGAVTARLLDGAGDVLAEHPLTGGVAVAEAPDDLDAVETLDADGRVLDRAEPLGDEGTSW
jgi:hypothetical protein